MSVYSHPEIISEVRIGRVDGEFIINPTRAQMENLNLNLSLVATDKNIMMVEGEAKECQEEDLVKALEIAHEAIKIRSRLSRVRPRLATLEHQTLLNQAFAKDKMHANPHIRQT